MQSLPEHVKTGLDIVAIAGWVSALAGALTALFGLAAAVGSAVWIWWRIHDRYKSRL